MGRKESGRVHEFHFARAAKSIQAKEEISLSGNSFRVTLLRPGRGLIRSAYARYSFTSLSGS
jgi:hypothetical protein